jgi:hypothetical protein
MGVLEQQNHNPENQPNYLDGQQQLAKKSNPDWMSVLNNLLDIYRNDSASDDAKK